MWTLSLHLHENTRPNLGDEEIQVHLSEPPWEAPSPYTFWVKDFYFIYHPRKTLDHWNEESSLIISGWAISSQVYADMIWPFKCSNFKDVSRNKKKSLTHNPENCSAVQFISVAQSCPTLCNPMNCHTPGLPVCHQLPEFTQTHVHRVGDAIQPSHPLSSPSPPAFNLLQHQGLFKWVSSSHQVAKVLEFQLQHQSLQWTPRTDFL